VPYTVEEMAFFKADNFSLQVAATPPNANKKPISELPKGSESLVSEAQKDFSARDFPKAEQKYLEILKRDDKNANTLANLAAIQLEMDHLDDAEKNIKQALAVAPQDAYGLALSGYIKYRREKYDEALDTLSRAAKLSPQNPEIQNYIGLTLSHKGMRGPAETAYRKAIQIDPGFGAAHNNLAVIYLTQKPPLVELARWHYQKAQAAGIPRNADLDKMFEEKGNSASK
jgi:Flp pilus assembly protein TadD